MAPLVDWIRARIVGLWRSRTIRLAVYAASAWAAGTYAANHGLFPASVFGQVDPILYQSAAFKIVLAIVGVVAVMNVLAAFDNMIGLSFRQHWLPALFGYDPLRTSPGDAPVAGNVAVATYLGLRFLGACVLIGWGLG